MEIPKETPPLLRLADATRVFNLSKSTLIRLRNAGKVKTFKTIGGQHMFYRDSLLEFIKSNSNEVQQPQSSL
jgi:hypothetical protein